MLTMLIRTIPLPPAFSWPNLSKVDLETAQLWLHRYLWWLHWTAVLQQPQPSSQKASMLDCTSSDPDCVVNTHTISPSKGITLDALIRMLSCMGIATSSAPPSWRGLSGPTPSPRTTSAPTRAPTRSREDEIAAKVNPSCPGPVPMTEDSGWGSNSKS